MQKFTTIQLLRAIAALLVVLFHLSNFLKEKCNYELLYGLFNGGWVGVDLFFVISGFIIYYISSQDIGNKDKFFDFISKRILRIYPIYFCIMIVIIPVVLLNPSFGHDYVRNSNFIILSLLLFPQIQAPLLPVTWSLSYEMFFYFIFSAMILFKHKIMYLTIVLWVTTVLGTILGIVHFENFYLDFVFNKLNIEFILGCLAAHFVLKNKKVNIKTCLLIGTIMFFVVFVLLTKDIINSRTSLVTVSFGLSIALIIIGLVNMEKQNKIHIPKTIVLIGDASYVLYLIHWFFQSASYKLFVKTGSTNYSYYSIANILLCITCAILIHKMVELPLQKTIKHKFIKRISLSYQISIK